MAVLEVNFTRMELGKMKERLTVAQKGHKLLKNKCDGLVRQFANLKKKVFELRKEVAAGLREVFFYFELAKAEFSSEEFDFFITSFQSEKLLIDVGEKNVMGVRLPVLKASNFKQLKSFQFLLSQSSHVFDESVKRLFEIFPNLLNLAQLEHSIKTISIEIKQTRRKVNALEFLIIPNYVDTIQAIELKLEENERNNFARLSRVKNNNNNK